jgi:hypothetical protein
VGLEGRLGRFSTIVDRVGVLGLRNSGGKLVWVWSIVKAGVHLERLIVGID